MPTIAERLAEVLRVGLDPEELRVDDEGHLHVGHPGAREGGHYRVFITARRFEGMSLLDRHRAVYSQLDGELRRAIHALAITARAPGEK